MQIIERNYSKTNVFSNSNFKEDKGRLKSWGLCKGLSGGLWARAWRRRLPPSRFQGGGLGMNL